MGDDTVVIETKLGQLRGLQKLTSLSNKKYFGFYGIPFAKPPIGELRFKAPVPFGGWDGVRDAVADGNMAMQSKIIPVPGEDMDTPEGDEDCLVLNVFVNEMPGQIKSMKPVMVSIHGGGFIGGSGISTTSGPDYLVEQDIVLVTFNYRCGAFGFLSLETDEVPGNAGMKDQTLALQWVRDNIESFGGDPNNVTIFGISAGGASVDFHLLSPLSKGLFHKAIIQSGYATTSWATQKTPRANAFELAHAMGCNSVNPALVLKFLQSVSSDQIVKTTKRISKNKDFMNNLGLLFTPCVEVAGSNRFLSDSPRSLFEKGEYNRVPMMLGNCRKEGTVITFFDGVNDDIISRLNENHNLLVPAHYIPLESESPEKRKAAEALWQFYMEGKPLTWATVNNYLRYQSDVMFNIGMWQAREYNLKTSKIPVYTYIFSNHSRCFCKLLAPLMPAGDKLFDEDTCHAADIPFLYSSTTIPTPPMTSEHVDAIKKHTKAWANFVSTGDPNCKELGTTWHPDSKTNPSYMDIGITWVSNKGVPFGDRCQFWDQLMTTYKSSS